MHESARRKRKKAHSRRKTVVYAGIFFLFLLITAGYFLFRYYGTASLISPLPKSLKSSLVSQASEAKKLSLLLEKAGIASASVSLRDTTSFEVTLSEGAHVIFSATKPVDIQVSSLQLMLSRFTIEGKKFSQIDLRFERPVIVFK